MELASNSLTKVVTERLKRMKLDWRLMARMFKNSHSYYDDNNFSGRFAEKYVRTALENACEDLEEQVILDPILSEKRTKNYLFVPKQGNVLIYTPDKQNCCELDELLLIDNLPVIFEITIAKWKGGIGGVNASKRTSRTIHKFMPKLLDVKIKPVMEYYERPCGYVIMALPDQVHMNSPYVKNFIDIGGIFIPLPFTYDQLRKEAELVKKSCAL